MIFVTFKCPWCLIIFSLFIVLWGKNFIKSCSLIIHLIVRIKKISLMERDQATIRYFTSERSEKAPRESCLGLVLGINVDGFASGSRLYDALPSWGPLPPWTVLSCWWFATSGSRGGLLRLRTFSGTRGACAATLQVPQGTVKEL